MTHRHKRTRYLELEVQKFLSVAGVNFQHLLQHLNKFVLLNSTILVLKKRTENRQPVKQWHKRKFSVSWCVAAPQRSATDRSMPRFLEYNALRSQTFTWKGARTIWKIVASDTHHWPVYLQYRTCRRWCVPSASPGRSTAEKKDRSYSALRATLHRNRRQQRRNVCTYVCGHVVGLMLRWFCVGITANETKRSLSWRKYFLSPFSRSHCGARHDSSDSGKIKDTNVSNNEENPDWQH